jgi:hypothetical protein
MNLPKALGRRLKIVNRKRVAFLHNVIIVATLWNQTLFKEVRLSKRLNPALIGGAHAVGRSHSRFATARTREQVLRR